MLFTDGRVPARQRHRKADGVRRLTGLWRNRGVAGVTGLALVGICYVPAFVKGTAAASQEPVSASRAAERGASAKASDEPDTRSRPFLRLLSQAQYFNTITDVFGPDAIPNLSFPPFQRTDGLLATGAAYEGAGEAQLELYQRAASIVAEHVVAPSRRDFLIPCKPADEKAPDSACATTYLTAVGQRLFRRPLSAAKVEQVVREAAQGAERLGDFYSGLSLAIEGLLLSPKTLFIEDVSEPDPAHAGQQRLDAYSLASRLSFFLWNRGPDQDLLKAAANGDLHSAKGRARIVEAMIASAKFEGGVRAFFDDMLGFDDFATLAKDAGTYPAFTGQAVEDAREQTLRTIIDLLVTHNGDYRDLFTTRTTFISPGLAPLYRVPTGVIWTRYEAPPDSQRVGLLTQISFLALHSHPGRSSPTRRGQALRELLMCQPVPRPPANVDFTALENPDPRLHTARDRLEFHRKNPACASCHRIMDPIGLALENFDGAGAYRDTEKGAPIDTSGMLEGKEYKDAAGLGQAVHDSPAVPACLVKRAYSYAVGGRVPPDQKPMVDYFNERFATEGYRVPSLMRMIALSKAFSEVENPRDNPATAVTTAHPPSSRVTSANGK